MADLHEHILVPELTTYLLPDDGRIPNNPYLPLLVYGGALKFNERDPAALCEQIIKGNGWGKSWRDGIYSFNHYHSTAHEVLAIARGEARVHFGGESGPKIGVKAGDVVLIPAGVGHKNLGSSHDLLVIGAYPPGQNWDLCRGAGDERPWALENIARVPLPDTDPIYGSQGPLLTHWLAVG
jgi:uncharacterized protein YjlB